MGLMLKWAGLKYLRRQLDNAPTRNGLVDVHDGEGDALRIEVLAVG